MPSANINKDLLARFSPSLEFFALSHGDGRVKIWDTLKGHLQVEFADIAPASTDFFESKPENGHLSVDYTCMEWVQLNKKKKKKPGVYALVLGTGSGDVLALDVAGGQLKWRVSDCHPGGVNAVSFSGNTSSVFTAGVDGMVCQIDCSTGNLLGKFKASSKAISSLSASPGGKMLASAAGQLRIFDCSDFRKIQKFSGHPVGIRCMTFSEDGKYILSSAVGEKFIIVWKIDRSKNRSACCVLLTEHPIVSLDCKGGDEDDDVDGLYVLAVSEAGLCYFWHGRDVQNLRDNKPTMISLSTPSFLIKNSESAPAIYSAKLQGILKPASGSVLLVHGSIVKPQFEKVNVQYGVNVNVSWSQQGALLPTIEPYESQKELMIKKKVSTLDRANAEDAVIPFAKAREYRDKKRKHKEYHSVSARADEIMVPFDDEHMVLEKVSKDKVEEEGTDLCLEDVLKSEGILSNKDVTSEESDQVLFSGTSGEISKNIHVLVIANRPKKKIIDSVLAMFHGDASKLLGLLILMWKSRSVDEEHVIPWISHTIVNHGHSLVSQDSHEEVINEMCMMTMMKCSAYEPLLQLSGCLQLITAQIDKSASDTIQALPTELPHDESDDDDDEDIDEVVYGEEDTSQSSDGIDD